MEAAPLFSSAFTPFYAIYVRHDITHYYAFSFCLLPRAAITLRRLSPQRCHDYFRYRASGWPPTRAVSCHRFFFTPPAAFRAAERAFTRQILRLSHAATPILHRTDCVTLHARLLACLSIARGRRQTGAQLPLRYCAIAISFFFFVIFLCDARCRCLR